ncbi:MAG: hypothetical protein KDK07_07400 [Bauldia sp.]|nr:hypothetical protein [Bauldia sp.]
MKHLAAAIASASMVVMAVSIGPVPISADGFDRIGPADPDSPIWSGDRMRGARDRLKDILPGGRST